MKVYRTTSYAPDGMKMWVRYSQGKTQFHSARSSWYRKYRRGRVTLEQVEVPEEAWELISDTEEE